MAGKATDGIPKEMLRQMFYEVSASMDLDDGLFESQRSGLHSLEPDGAGGQSASQAFAASTELATYLSPEELALLVDDAHVMTDAILKTIQHQRLVVDPRMRALSTMYGLQMAVQCIIGSVPSHMGQERLQVIINAWTEANAALLLITTLVSRLPNQPKDGGSKP